MVEKEYINDQREMYKERNDFSDTDYFKIVTLSMKFYKQGADLGKDIEGNSLTENEINICRMLIDKMNVEIAAAEKKFNQDKED